MKVKCLWCVLSFMRSISEDKVVLEFDKIKWNVDDDVKAEILNVVKNCQGFILLMNGESIENEMQGVVWGYPKKKDLILMFFKNHPEVMQEVLYELTRNINLSGSKTIFKREDQG